MSKQWFILSTFTSKENKVADELKKLKKENPNIVGEILLPKQSDGSVRFPGYVFAELDVFKNFVNGTKNEDNWNKVSNLPEMIGFLGGDSPRPMSEDEIASLRAMIEMKDEKKIVFNVGDSVKILDGAFANNIGIISNKDDEKQIAIVDFELFGEQMKAEVQYSSLEKNQ